MAKPSASLLKVILNALSERDETADICTDSKGNPEPDPELRDYENVPLKEDINEYFEREVKPHVRFIDKVIDRMEQNSKILTHILDDEEVREEIEQILMREAYRRLRNEQI